jgi:hypothetical protein
MDAAIVLSMTFWRHREAQIAIGMRVSSWLLQPQQYYLIYKFLLLVGMSASQTLMPMLTENLM